MSAPRFGKPLRFEGLAIFCGPKGWIVREGYAGFPLGGPRLAGPFATKDEATAARAQLVQAIRAKRRGGERTCLCCRAIFFSEGPHNRLCPACSQRAARLPAQMAG